MNLTYLSLKRDLTDIERILEWFTSDRRDPMWTVRPSPLDKCRATSPSHTATCRRLGFRHRLSGTNSHYCTDTRRDCHHKLPNWIPGPACSYRTDADPPTIYAADYRTQRVLASWHRVIAECLSDRDTPAIPRFTAHAMRDNTPDHWCVVDALMEASGRYAKLDTNQRRLEAQHILAAYIAAGADAIRERGDA